MSLPCSQHIIDLEALQEIQLFIGTRLYFLKILTQIFEKRILCHCPAGNTLLI